MRSLGFTTILALLAVLTSGLASWQWTQGNFDSLLGAPNVPIGQFIYSKFTAASVKHINVNHNGTNARFDLTSNGWQATSPWADRMDPRAAIAIINFTLGMRVEDFADRHEIDTREAGLGETAIEISLTDGDNKPLAHYKLGRQTPWLAKPKDEGLPVATVFIQTRDDHNKRFIYSATGDIGPLFKDNLKFLRDHRPFYFNPITTQKIRITTEQGELTLSRETPKSPWRLIKPLDLSTDRQHIKSLLEDLYELQALKVSGRTAVTLPGNNGLTKSQQISISSFGSEKETLLEIFPPETPESREVYAVVSDRPNTIFTLPSKPEPNLVSIADLPLTVNELRDPSLTNLNIQSLRGILIQPSTGTEILISRTPPQPWMATIAGQSQEANEERLFTLLKAVTEGRATGFESDAATDFTPWGLDRPFLNLHFLGQDNQGIRLAFGIDGKGGFFVNRIGTPTVMRIDPSLVSSIPVRPYEWRNSRLWSVDRTNLMAIERQPLGGPALMLRYDFNQEEWSAQRGSDDLTASLDPTRANYLLEVIEGLKVTRWLATDDEAAMAALAQPSLTLKIIEKGTNDIGDFTGLIYREVTLAPSSTESNPGFYYGRLSSGDRPFLLDRTTYGKLVTPVFENQ